ncbi:MAG: hypothetical protein HRT47_00890 [Candidatus Caenarcaniphilales bacterium]|nr:hypothetical protein [Candidatus Caenarcaniphilales bacterium]
MGFPKDIREIISNLSKAEKTTEDQETIDSLFDFLDKMITFNIKVPGIQGNYSSYEFTDNNLDEKNAALRFNTGGNLVSPKIEIFNNFDKYTIEKNKIKGNIVIK